MKLPSLNLFIRKSEFEWLQSQVQHLDSEVHWLRRCRDADRDRLEHQKEQIDTLKHRGALCETILMNVLARDVNCIVGWDYYLEKLQEIRKTDPDSRPEH